MLSAEVTLVPSNLIACDIELGAKVFKLLESKGIDIDDFDFVNPKLN